MRTLMLSLAMTSLMFATGCAYNDRYSTYDPPTYSTSSYEAERAAAQAAADRALETRVREQFNRYGDLSASARNIEISAHNGNVALTGRVANENEKEMIDAMVRNTPGVTSVNSYLQVSPSPVISYNPNDRVPSDRALVSSVHQALRRERHIAPYASDIHVAADNGTVTLTGYVPSETDRQMVEGVVRNTPGVVGLIDQMRTSASPTGRVEEPSRVYSGDAGQLFSLHVQGLNEEDRETAQRVLQGLRTDTVLPTLLPMVNINVSGGKVTLQGTVQDQRQRRAIVSAVERAVGANNVYDQLQLAGGR